MAAGHRRDAAGAGAGGGAKVKRWRTLFVVAAAAWGGWSCTEHVRPEPGILLVVLSGVQPGDAALLFSLEAPDSIIAVTGASGMSLHARRSAEGLRVAVFGSVADGVVMTLDVPDVRRAPLWTATLLEVADTANGLRASLSGYQLRVAR